MMKLTDKQRSALLEASVKGSIFQIPESRKHSPNVLSSLCKAGLLARAPIGVIWEITPAGIAALEKQKV